MSLFLGTHQNRLDAKGRTSVPALFRTALRQTAASPPASSTDSHAHVLILRPSHLHACIEAWPLSVFNEFANPLETMDTFSVEADALTTALYAEAYPVEPDKEGRILLPETLVKHAGVTDTVIFKGQGRSFQIWEPEAADRHTRQARELARDRGLTLPGRPRQPAPVAPQARP